MRIRSSSHSQLPECWGFFVRPHISGGPPGYILVLTYHSQLRIEGCTCQRTASFRRFMRPVTLHLPTITADTNSTHEHCTLEQNYDHTHTPLHCTTPLQDQHIYFVYAYLYIHRKSVKTALVEANFTGYGITPRNVRLSCANPNANRKPDCLRNLSRSIMRWGFDRWTFTYSRPNFFDYYNQRPSG